MKKIKKIITVLLCLNLSLISLTYAQDKMDNNLSLQEITLPSEVKDLGKQSGSIYYNNSVKNKVLIPTHIWGEVIRPGLHFIPTDTTLIKELSMAGGPSGSAKIDDIILTRTLRDGKVSQHEFNLSEGGALDAHAFKLEPGDSIFVKKDQFREDRSYYTSLIGIAISIISTVVLLQSVKK